MTRDRFVTGVFVLTALVVLTAVCVTGIVGAAVMLTALWAGDDHDAWIGAGALGVATGSLCAVGWAIDRGMPNR